MQRLRDLAFALMGVVCVLGIVWLLVFTFPICYQVLLWGGLNTMRILFFWALALFGIIVNTISAVLNTKDLLKQNPQ